MKKIPKQIEQLFLLFPALQIGSVLYVLITFSQRSVSLSLLLLIFMLYGLSPLLWRILLLFYKAIPTSSYVGKFAKQGNLWLISYQLQFIYNTFPTLESFLKFLPGCYSAWLRLWGSRIGKKINWAPVTYLVDRTNLILGDRLLIGNKTYMTGHVLKKKDNKYFLFFKPIIIGDDSFISFSCTIGPGTILPPKSFLKAFAVEYQSDYRNPTGIKEQTHE